MPDAIRLRSLEGPLAAEIGGVEGAPRLVFVHGFTQTGRSWLPVAGHFARQYEIVLIDAPGHGGSASVRADLRRAADMIVEIGGPATYVGYSMGGRMVLHVALAHSWLVHGLVLLSATAGISDSQERAARMRSDDALAQRIERDGVDAFLAEWLAQPMFAGLPDDPEERAQRRRNTAEGLACSLRLDGTGTQTPLWDRLREITSPTLVLAGERDPKFVALGRQLAAGITRSTFGLIHEAGHAAHLEKPVQVITRMEGFLNREGLR